MDRKITILEETTKNPYELIGRCSGLCWGSNVEDRERNIKRGKECVEHQHGRTLEFPQIYFEAEGYSARVIREFYTHIGGAPTRLQASTRYIDYGNFDYVTPPSITAKNLNEEYEWLMYTISDAFKDFQAAGVPKEDIANILPLGMTTKIIVRTNLRNLIDMAHQRKCQRAYWEFRQFFADLQVALLDYSREGWEEIISKHFIPKCKYLGYCPEGKNSCKNKKI